MTVPQVSQLFADHPDLLMEFTYFLPDAVQEQVRVGERERGREGAVVVVMVAVEETLAGVTVVLVG